MKLYEINQQYDTLKKYINDTDTSEEMFKEAFNEIEAAFEDKAENIVKLIKNIEGDVEAHKVEEKRIFDKRKFMENHVIRLKKMLEESMVQMDKNDVKAGTFTLKIQKNPYSVEIEDESLIPEAYKSIEQVIKIDKKHIVDDYKVDQMLIPGVKVQQTESLRIK